MIHYDALNIFFEDYSNTKGYKITNTDEVSSLSLRGYYFVAPHYAVKVKGETREVFTGIKKIKKIF